jgi:outer membrane protein W
VAQVNRNLFVNRPWSYVGAGLNLGLEGDTDLGDTSFAIISKIAIGNNLSLRPGAIIGENVAILVPVTYDFVVPSADPFEASLLRPYVGGGIVFTTNDTAADEGVDNNVGPMITGGLDVRFNDKWVANAGLNVGFLGDDAEFGIVIGVGYIFSNR